MLLLLTPFSSAGETRHGEHSHSESYTISPRSDIMTTEQDHGRLCGTTQRSLGRGYYPVMTHVVNYGSSVFEAYDVIHQRGSGISGSTRMSNDY